MAEHYGLVERMRLNNAEAAEVWITRHSRLPVSAQELAAETEFSKLTLIGADRQSPCMTYRPQFPLRLEENFAFKTKVCAWFRFVLWMEQGICFPTSDTESHLSFEIEFKSCRRGIFIQSNNKYSNIVGPWLCCSCSGLSGGFGSSHWLPKHVCWVHCYLIPCLEIPNQWSIGGMFLAAPRSFTQKAFKITDLGPHSFGCLCSLISW